MKTITMKKFTSILLLTLFFYACSTVPITGRKQISLVSTNEILPASLAKYKETLKEQPLSSDMEKTQMVKRVGHNLSVAVDKFLRENGKSAEADAYQWEFNLFENKEENAWCLPGGKVAIYTGILPVCKNEDGLAAVMGHEIAHAFAHHGEERMSEGMLAQLGGIAVAVGTANNDHAQIWNMAYGLGSGLGMLAFSRTHEKEADELGMVFMIMAGYDPEEAVYVWERMAARDKKRPPVILATHPSNQQRVNDLKAFLPQAREYARKYM